MKSSLDFIDEDSIEDMALFFIPTKKASSRRCYVNIVTPTAVQGQL